MSVHEHIRRYYETPGTAHALEAGRKTRSVAQEVMRSLRKEFAVVTDPSVDEYANCIKIRVRFDPNAPGVEDGQEALREYVAAQGRPWVEIGLFLSWVGPFAVVRVGTYELGPAGEMLMNQVVGDEEIYRAEETCKDRLRSFSFRVLTEEALRQPVDVKTELVNEKDGNLDRSPLTVGKVLFYPWWSGEEYGPRKAWNLTR